MVADKEVVLLGVTIVDAVDDIISVLIVEINPVVSVVGSIVVVSVVGSIVTVVISVVGSIGVLVVLDGQ